MFNRYLISCKPKLEKQLSAIEVKVKMELVTFLDWFFYVVTQLGEEMFYIVALAFVYWSFNKKLGKKLAIVVLTSLWINGFFKFLLKLPRPPKSVQKIEASGYGFPSGHAQGSTTLWGYLSLKIKKNWFYLFSAILIAMISYSRIYLQVHYIQDIIGGFLLGVATLIAFEYIDRKSTSHLSSVSFLQKLAIPAIFTLILVSVPYILFSSSDDIAGMIVIAGAFFGITEGFIIEEEKVKLNDPTTTKSRIIRFLIGLTIVIPIMIALRQVLSESLTSVFLLYTIIGLLMGLVVPYIFKKLEL